MRLVVSSDWHGDWHTSGFERLDDLVTAQQEVLKECEQDNTVFLFLGDLSNPFSRNCHQSIANALRFARTLNDRRVPNYWLVGNHDVVADARGSHTLMALRELRGSTYVLDTPGVCLSMLALPFTPPNRAYDPAKVIEEIAAGPDASKIRLIAGHLNIEGIEPGSETTDMARGREIFWPAEAIEKHFPKALRLNGHYHRQQTFNGINIPGSLLRLTHGEEQNTPGFLVFKDY